MYSCIGTRAAVLLAAAALAWPVAAQPVASRITQVTLYPGSATVERSLKVPAGTRRAVFSCLPGTLDPQSVQVQAGAAVRIGDLSVQTEPREWASGCLPSPLDARIRALEEQKAQASAEADAWALVTAYLKSVNGAPSEAGKPAPDVKAVAAMAETLRRTGQDAIQQQQQQARRLAELDRALKPLLAERARLTGGDDARVVTVSVTVTASADADLALRYQVSGTGWTPAYRASLSTDTGQLRIERQALVAQSTGEDWRGVKLLLATGQPRRDLRGPQPHPWRIGLAGAALAQEFAKAQEILGRAAPAAAADAGPDRAREPSYEVSVDETAFATEFSVPQPVDLPTGGPQAALSLGLHEDRAQLWLRTQPKVDAAAYLIAEAALPPGVWPPGPVQLLRDGAFVGTGRWPAPSEARWSMAFGRDERLRVRVEPERDNQGRGGLVGTLVGTRTERRLQRAYSLENRHSVPVRVQVLEAAPVSVDDQVKVTTLFEPVPAEPAWMQMPGVAMWTLELAAGASTRVSADYTISHPKDARLQMR